MDNKKEIQYLKTIVKLQQQLIDCYETDSDSDLDSDLSKSVYHINLEDSISSEEACFTGASYEEILDYIETKNLRTTEGNINICSKKAKLLKSFLENKSSQTITGQITDEQLKTYLV